MSASRRVRGWQRRTLACTALLTSAALILPVQTAYAAPEPDDRPTPADQAPPAGALSQQSLPVLLARLQSLYRKAEEATEEYNDAKDKLDKQRRYVEQLDARLADQREDLRRSRKAAGQLARRQYRNAGLSDYGKLLVSDDPQRALESGHLLSQTAKIQAETIRRLRQGEQELDRLTRKQKSTLDRIKKYADKQRKARDRVEEQLDQVERIVSSLTGAQLEELQALEERGFNAAQAEFLRSGALGSGSRAPSKAGRKAIGYAFNQLGDPYVWGAEGPDSFDCSGLTSQAWRHAGRAIPRTSQEQWRQLPKVPLNRLRPGDLVVYYPGATHVGMYIGNAMIVHAPRPGSFVKVAPIGSMPVMGAVRPDPDAKPDSGYKTPKIPEKGRKASPIGTGRGGGSR